MEAREWLEKNFPGECKNVNHAGQSCKFAIRGRETEVLESYAAPLREQIKQASQILKDACDRDWQNEDLHAIATIAANAMHWRNEEIRSLRDRNDELYRKCVEGQRLFQEEYHKFSDPLVQQALMEKMMEPPPPILIESAELLNRAEKAESRCLALTQSLQGYDLKRYAHTFRRMKEGLAEAVLLINGMIERDNSLVEHWRLLAQTCDADHLTKCANKIDYANETTAARALLAGKG